MTDYDSYELSILINRTYDVVATMLGSFTAGCLDDNIEIGWTLSEVASAASFRVLRERIGVKGFFLAEGEPVREGALSYRFTDSGCEPGASYCYRVEVLDEAGSRILFETEDITVPALSLVLHQNAPNPFNPVTTIGYYMPERGHVTLDIFDASGRLIKTLVDRVQDEGRHESVWSGCDATGVMAASGVYFYRLTAGKTSISRKMVLLQ